MNPESVISLCEELYGKKPAAYLLTIKGFSWELDSAMSEKAIENLNSAMDFAKKLFK